MSINSSGKKLEGFFTGKGFYIVLFLCAAVIGLSAWMMAAGNEAMDDLTELNKGISFDASKVETIIIPPQSSAEDSVPVIAPEAETAPVIAPEQSVSVWNEGDVMAVEATQQFRGLYHVLGGVISPMDGIGPSDLQIESLVERVKSGEVKEVILALSPNMEGDTTNFFIFRKLAPFDVKMSVIARGISVGDELEYADEVTLGRSIVNRTLFTGNM